MSTSLLSIAAHLVAGDRGGPWLASDTKGAGPRGDSVFAIVNKVTLSRARTKRVKTSYAGPLPMRRLLLRWRTLPADGRRGRFVPIADSRLERIALLSADKSSTHILALDCIEEGRYLGW
jgi:hypothetical protein